MNLARGAHEFFKGVTITAASTGDPELDKMFKTILDDKFLDTPFPVGCYVRVKMSMHELVVFLMHDMDMKIQEARGYALEILEGPNEVIGQQSLSDEQGIFRPYVTILSSSGAMFCFLYDQLEKVGDCLYDLSCRQ